MLLSHRANYLNYKESGAYNVQTKGGMNGLLNHYRIEFITSWVNYRILKV